MFKGKLVRTQHGVRDIHSKVITTGKEWYKPIPKPRGVIEEDEQENYDKLKRDIEGLIKTEMKKLKEKKKVMARGDKQLMKKRMAEVDQHEIGENMKDGKH